MSFISVNNICHSYGKNKVLHGCSFAINKGQIVALLGESGSGKTTILRTLAGFERPDSGSISMNNSLLYDQQTMVLPEDRNIGLVFQDYALFPHLNIRKNIELGKSAGAKRTTSQWLNVVGLDGLDERRPDQLSGGQQQRVAIVRALAAEPELILLDEPFSNIDESLKFGFRHELRKLLKEEGVSAVFVTHDTKDALAIADQIVILKDGEIRQIGTPETIYESPADLYVTGLLGPYNVVAKNGNECSIIRAEQCSIEASSQQKGFVQSSMYQGNTFLIHIKISDQIWIVEHPFALTLGEEVGIHFETKNLKTVQNK
ncbi:MAG: iron(III) transport system ATP-binding protein [Flavobacteriales bacterium]|jgi:iron(III) transport system ATP-binding protein